MLDREVVTSLVELHNYNHAQSPRPPQHQAPQVRHRRHGHLLIVIVTAQKHFAGEKTFFCSMRGIGHRFFRGILGREVCRGQMGRRRENRRLTSAACGRRGLM